jgi:hypothetical protein
LPPDCTVTPRTAGISSGEKIDNVKALSPAIGRKTRRKKTLIWWHSLPAASFSRFDRRDLTFARSIPVN